MVVCLFVPCCLDSSVTACLTPSLSPPSSGVLLLPADGSSGPSVFLWVTAGDVKHQRLMWDGLDVDLLCFGFNLTDYNNTTDGTSSVTVATCSPRPVTFT